MKMKQILSLFLSFALLISMVLPASASGSDWVNVLDYADVGGSQNNYFKFSGTTSLDFDLGYVGMYGSFDLIVNVTGDRLTAASINGHSLSVSALSSKVFRIYGDASRYISSQVLTLDLTSAGTSYCEIIAFRASGLFNNRFPATGQISVDWSPVNSTGFVTMPDVDTPAEVFWGGATATDDVSPFTAWIYPNRWKDYDFIDFSMFVRAQSIESITVTHDGELVPFELSFLDTISQTWVDPNNSSTQFNFTDLSEVYISLRIDVSGLDKNSSSLPRIGITGQYRDNNSNNRLALFDVVGHVSAEPENPIIHWLKKIYSTLIGEGSGADDIGSTIESQAGELEGIGDALGDVTKPDIDDLDGSLDDLVSPDQVDAVGSVFAPLFHNNTILHILIMSLTLALVSYVLYGKR